MKPGETDVDKRTVSFDLNTDDGPASGEVNEGAVVTVVAGDLKISYDYGATYTNAWATTANGGFAHGGDGNYRVTFSLAEVAESVGEKNIWLRLKKTGVRTRVVLVELRYTAIDNVLPSVVTSIQTGLATSSALSSAQTAILAAIPSAATIRDAILDALLQDHSVVGSVADGIAIAAGLLQGNFYIDQTNNTNPYGQTAARVRLFRNGAAMASVTDGGSGQGEFATFLVQTTYSGPSKIATHKVVRQ